MRAIAMPNDPPPPVVRETGTPPSAASLLRRLRGLGNAEQARDMLPLLPRFANEYAQDHRVQRALSETALRARALEQAVQLARTALGLRPDELGHQLHFAICLLAAGQQDEAAIILSDAQVQAWDSANQVSLLASLLVRGTRHQQAAECYERAVELEPENAKHHFSLAATYRFLGRLEDAETACDRAVALDPKEFEAYLIRADLRTQTAAKNHVEAMESVLADGADHYMGEVMLCHALAKECEDIGLYQKSFKYLSRGAALRKEHLSYEVNRDLRIIDRLIETFTEERIQSAASEACTSSEPIFVIGMPRTGTTLVERIIGSHSDVESAGELPNFSQVMTRMVHEQAAGGEGSPEEMIAASLELDIRQLGESYIESTRGLTGETAYFIDKLPFNYLNVALIRLALPNARIVHVTRDPMDTCYAVFKTLFQRAYPFSYDLHDLGRYFAAYQRLMNHWYKLFPGSMLTIAYEDLVENTQSESKRLLDHCGLTWQDQVSEFHQSEAPSMTASASQVRQPVYRSSVGKWRNYERQLSPLIGILESAGIGFQR